MSSGNFVGVTTMLDCPDPVALAEFYAKLTESGVSPHMVIKDDQPHWVFIGHPDSKLPILAFQRIKNYVAPTWPEGPIPMQMHLDFDVHDLDAAEKLILENGGTKADFQPSSDPQTNYRVFMDPVGHVFCITKV